MTNTDLIIKELSFLLKSDEADLKKYISIIEHAAEYVKTKLKNSDNCNNARIIHLCAVKVYYQITLIEDSEICSFSAGDISYSTNSASADRAENLLKNAIADCSDLLKGTDFAFKVV